jgi:ribonuclease Z
LVENYATDFVIVAHEWNAGDCLYRARFRSKARFVRESLENRPVIDGVLLDDPQFKVRAVALEHHDIASLAFSFEESTHINVWKNKLDELGLPTGPWLTELKKRVREGGPDETPIRIYWRTREGSREEILKLGELKRAVLEFVPGQKVCYVTDVAIHQRNRNTLIEFVRDANLLFIEAVFLDADRDQAEHKAHLTASAAGEIARAANVRLATPFHFSPRYLDREAELRDEFERHWRG